jgi:hypothetical protein
MYKDDSRLTEMRENAWAITASNAALKVLKLFGYASMGSRINDKLPWGSLDGMGAHNMI